MMTWRKLGRVFEPEKHLAPIGGMVSHAANPFAEQAEKAIYRVFFSARDETNRSHVCACLLDLENRAIVQVDANPLIAPGEAGLFDDSGSAMGWLLNFQGNRLLYYLGWNLKVTVPWMNTIGVAAWNPTDQQFEKVGRAPVLDRSNVDPFSVSYPCILEVNGRLLMWYGSNLGWGPGERDMAHVIKTASSEDGIHWNRPGRIAIGLEHPGEFAISKPCVLRETDGFRMWYSYRADGAHGSYRIGAAVSEDAENWSRRDEEVGIDVSSEGWDSQMICYAHVFDHDGGRFMLYNGNGYGQSGFGLAVLD